MIGIVLLLFLMAGLSEVWLVRLNWIGRKKLGMFEMNRLWRWFDRRGLTSLALGIHLAFIFGLLSLWLLLEEIVILAVVTGALFTNAFIDHKSIGRHMKCRRFCPKYDECMRERRGHCYKVWERKK